MNIEKALQILTNDRLQYSLYESVEHDEAYGLAMDALEHMKHYEQLRERDTSKEAIEELEVIPTIDANGAYVDVEEFITYYKCPVCGERVGIDDVVDCFCRACGQRLKAPEEN